jgi:hypothetical protein
MQRRVGRGVDELSELNRVDYHAQAPVPGGFRIVEKALVQRIERNCECNPVNPCLSPNVKKDARFLQVLYCAED